MRRIDFNNYLPLYTGGNLLVRELIRVLDAAKSSPTQASSDAILSLLEADVANMRTAAVRPVPTPEWAEDWSLVYTGNTINIASKGPTEWVDGTTAHVQIGGQTFTKEGPNAQGVWVVPLGGGDSDATITFDFWLSNEALTSPKVRVTDLTITG
ncbi:hypothetical protein XaavBphi31_54 [Xanthomonas phage Xaa_vB_phi31]|uniref:Uncharacterized protein n=1 Tax=Xanthomonas phage Xaa_vB_phi31 TaxID=2776752 RepID=A0A868BZ32_9CAUD|nr:hypothetical protein XaavBphi31_54 [Xanthomonas phage Xaa_vB_phi31]